MAQLFNQEWSFWNADFQSQSLARFFQDGTLVYSTYGHAFIKGNWWLDKDDPLIIHWNNQNG